MTRIDYKPTHLLVELDDSKNREDKSARNWENLAVRKVHPLNDLSPLSITATTKLLVSNWINRTIEQTKSNLNNCIITIVSNGIALSDALAVTGFKGWDLLTD